MQIDTRMQLDYCDVLILPKRSRLSSRKSVTLKRSFTFVNSQQEYDGIPIIVANMDTVGTIKMANAVNQLGVSVALHKHYDVNSLISFFDNEQNSTMNFYSMGILDHDLDKFIAVSEKANIKNVCIDVANGYTEKFLAFVKSFRDKHPSITIMAGNVVTPDMTSALILAGADIVKVGIGPGSVCTTRKIAGVGFPQLSAIIDCADAAHGLGGLVCGDGGLVNPGDFGKGFGGGADFLMAGGIFAGHDECEGEFVYEEDIVTVQRLGANAHEMVLRKNNTPTHMKFYGMSSTSAMTKHHGGVAEYRASEGKEVLIPYRGPIENTLREILGGVRSTCTYVGAAKLKELSKRTTFILVNRTHNTVFGS